MAPNVEIIVLNRLIIPIKRSTAAGLQKVCSAYLNCAEMDSNILPRSCEKGFSARERKHPYSLKDVKRKLSVMNKKIDDLHHQRKFMYKNSVKVKRMVHNQVNQIVKCLRTRERCLWSEIDEMYVSQDSAIIEKLSRFQSVYAHCQALLSHLEDFNGSMDVLAKVHSILSQENLEENSDAILLELISDFEGMKTKANTYGCLRNSKRSGELTLVSEKNEHNLTNVAFCQLHDKDESNFKTPLSATPESSAINEETDINDFQVIGLLEKISCHDSDDDFIMVDSETSLKEDKESNMDEFRKDTDVSSKFNSFKHSSESHQGNKEFNPDEEWKQIFEMNKKLAYFNEMTSKFSKNMVEHNIKSNVCFVKTDGEKCDNLKQNTLFSKKEADYWLQKIQSKSDVVAVKKNIENVNFKSVYPTPAEIIKNAFQRFLKKDNPQIWLSSQ